MGHGEAGASEYQLTMEARQGTGVLDKKDSDIVEVYLLLCNKMLSLFADVVQKLEAKGTTCVELYSIMYSFGIKLTYSRSKKISSIDI